MNNVTRPDADTRSGVQKKLDLSSGFVQVPVNVMRDSSLSLAAKGAYAILCSHKDGFSGSAKVLATLSKDGEMHCKTVLRELEDAGLIIRERRKTDQGKWEWTVTVCDSPTTKTIVRLPTDGLPTDGQPPHIIRRTNKAVPVGQPAVKKVSLGTPSCSRCGLLDPQGLDDICECKDNERTCLDCHGKDIKFGFAPGGKPFYYCPRCAPNAEEQAASWKAPETQAEKSYARHLADRKKYGWT